MPTFDTPQPISVTLEILLGDVMIAATDRTDTVVEVYPSDASQDLDVRAGEQTRVDFRDGRLLVKAPKQRGLGLFGRPGSIDVTIALPAGSHVRGSSATGSFQSAGRLGDCRFRTSAGDIQLDRTGPLDLSTSAGEITVEQVTGDANISTGTGEVRLREIDGAAVVKNSNGDSLIGTVTGEARLHTANGHISVDRAPAGITANTAYGDIRIGKVERGSVSVKTAYGELEIGIHAGTAAWLDAHTDYGRVRNRLGECEAPEQAENTVEVHARNSYGDILIHRS
jgi:DUF4097 and DUF4098 domain-containing protein YvlB